MSGRLQVPSQSSLEPPTLGESGRRSSGSIVWSESVLPRRVAFGLNTGSRPHRFHLMMASDC